ncbi:MAG: GTPase HflX [Pseudomonadota bacterium]
MTEPAHRDANRAGILLPIVTRSRSDGPLLRDPDNRLQETGRLAEALDLSVGESAWVTVRAVRPATFLGPGVVEAWRDLIEAHGLGIMIVDTALTGIQQRNLETAWQVKVVDRTGLILEIFADRARTREGRLQVDLAQFTYLKSRLVRTWTHLERQRGGLGTVGGPGETQIESDRRQIRERIRQLEKALATVTRTRRIQRAQRRKQRMPIIALVGYTNAGKSTLFNRLVSADVVAQDLLFATLDPTLRRRRLPGGTKAVFSDTVGFISDLPTDLVSAFRATLEEVSEADVILHVRDLVSASWQAEKADVLEVLESLSVSVETTPILEVWNKWDAVSAGERGRWAGAAAKAGAAIVSAQTGEGIDGLIAAIEAALQPRLTVRRLALHAGEGEAIAALHQLGTVHSIAENEAVEGGLLIEATLSPAAWADFDDRFAASSAASGAAGADDHADEAETPT